MEARDENPAIGGWAVCGGGMSGCAGAVRHAVDFAFAGGLTFAAFSTRDGDGYSAATGGAFRGPPAERLRQPGGYMGVGRGRLDPPGHIGAANADSTCDGVRLGARS